jgi:hypothetical protein
MPPSVAETELIEFIPQARRVAAGFARRRGRGMDAMFVDEMVAEAIFIVTVLIMEKYDEIVINHTDREAFYRMSIGYGLKEYVSARSTSTVSYLRKRGEAREHVALSSASLARNYNDIECYDIMETLCRDELDKHVIELYSIGNECNVIATKLGISEKMIKKILRRIRKGLRAYHYDGEVPKTRRLFRKPHIRELGLIGPITMPVENSDAANIRCMDSNNRSPA